MIKVIIIEDEPAALRRLERLLHDVEPRFEVCARLDSIEASVHWFNDSSDQPDLIFMDINLADGNSFDIFSKVEISSPVIFITAYDEYALKAFSVNSIDYLLKPVEAAELRRAIDRYYDRQNKVIPTDWSAVIKHINSNNAYRKRFIINKGDQLITVDINEVAFFQAEDKYVFLNTTTGMRYIITFKMEELEKALEPTKFYRINRGVILHLEALQKTEFALNGRLKLQLKAPHHEPLYVSRERTAGFKKWLEGI
jgi:DNA-binding LytR/AlgR family response regulator